MTKMYYVSYGSLVSLDQHVRGVDLRTALAVLSRSGVAWLYRGVLVGATRDQDETIRRWRKWRWHLWAPKCYRGGTRWAVVAGHTKIVNLPELALTLGLLRRVDDALAQTRLFDGNAADGIPWAVHQIADPEARTVAYAAYTRNRD